MREPEDDTEDDEVSRGRISEKSDEEISGDEDGGRDTEVGRDEVRVGDDIRIEGEEEDSEDAGEHPSTLPSHPVEEVCGEETDEDDRETGEEDDEIRIVAGSVEEERPDIPLLIHSFGPEGVVQGEDR